MNKPSIPASLDGKLQPSYERLLANDGQALALYTAVTQEICVETDKAEQHRAIVRSMIHPGMAQATLDLASIGLAYALEALQVRRDQAGETP